jgi:hypothetical protein
MCYINGENMRKEVSIEEIVDATKATVLYQGDYSYVKWAVASGLMSDVLTTEKEEILLVTSLSTSQVVRTADMVGAHAVMIACGKPIPSDTIQLAKELDITLLSTTDPVFEACCHLHDAFFKE